MTEGFISETTFQEDFQNDYFLFNWLRDVITTFKPIICKKAEIIKISHHVLQEEGTLIEGLQLGQMWDSLSKMKGEWVFGNYLSAYYET